VTTDNLSKVEDAWLSNDKEAEKLYSEWLSLLVEGEVVALSGSSGRRRVTVVTGVKGDILYLGEGEYSLESGRTVTNTCVWRKVYPATEQEKTAYMLTSESESLVTSLEGIVATVSPKMAPFALLVVREMKETLNKLNKLEKAR